MNITFTVNHQRLIRNDSSEPVNCTVEYLTAYFGFESQDWEDKDIICIARNNDYSFRLLLTLVDSDEMIYKTTIPSDVLVGNMIQISLYSLGTTRITTNIVNIPLYESGYSNNEIISQSRANNDVFNRIFEELNKRFDNVTKDGDYLVFYSNNVEKKRVKIN